MNHNDDNRKGILTMRSSKGSIARVLTLATILALVSFVLPANLSVSQAAVGGGVYTGPTSGSEGSTFSGALGTFTDAACGTHDKYVAKIDWGDGHIDTGAVTGSCSYTVSGTHVYQEEGNKVISVTVRSNIDGSVVKISGNDAIADAALSPNPGAPIGFAEGTHAYSQMIGSFTDADQFTDPATGNPVCDGTPSDYKVSIIWGDGTPVDATSGTVVPDPSTFCTFDVLASHQYAEEGSYTIRATVTDLGGASTIVVGAATVADAALSTLNSNTFKGVEGTFLTHQYLGTVLDSDPACQAADYSGTILWGDGTPPDVSTAKFLPSTHTVVPCAFDVFGTHVYTEQNQPVAAPVPYSITVTVTDHLSSTTLSPTANIADAPLGDLQTTPLNAACSLALAQSCALVESNTYSHIYLGTIHDYNLSPISSQGCSANDFYPGAPPAEGGLVTVNWGDGSPLDSNATDPNLSVAVAIAHPQTNKNGQPGFCNFDIYGMHQYVAENFAGYPVTVTLTDSGGSTTTLVDNAVVKDSPLDTPFGYSLSEFEGVPFGPVYGTNGLIGTFHDSSTTCNTEANPVTATPEWDGAGAPSQNHYTATVNWGDDTPVDTTNTANTGNVQLADLGGCTFEVLGSHNYTEDSTHQPTPCVGQPGNCWQVTITVQDTLDVADSSGPKTAKLVIDASIASPPESNVADAALTPPAAATFGNHGGANDCMQPNPAYVVSAPGCIYEGHAFGGQDGTATAAVSPGGSITGITVTNAGSNYSTAPFITIAGCTSLASAVANVSGGKITSINVTNGGAGCVAPTVTVNNGINLGTFHDTAGDNGAPAAACDITDYTAMVNYGDSGAGDKLPGNPHTLTSVANAFGVIVPSYDGIPCDFDVLGFYTYKEQSPPGGFTINVSLTDFGGFSTGWTDTAIVSDARLNNPVTNNFQPIEGHPTVSSFSAQPPGYQYLGTITDDDPFCSLDASDYQVVVDWSDGVPGIPGTPNTDTLLAGTGVLGTTPLYITNSNTHTTTGCAFDVYGVHTYTEESRNPGSPTYPVTVTVTDVVDSPGDNASVTWIDQANVLDAALTTIKSHNITTATEGVQTGNVAGTPVSLTPGVAPSGLTAGQMQQIYLGTIQDKAANATTCDSAGADFSNEQGIPFPGQGGHVIVNWGDGVIDTLANNAVTSNQAGSLGTITIVPSLGLPYGPAGTCNYDVFATHTWIEETEPGAPYPIKVTVADAGGQTTTINDTATVADQHLQPHAYVGSQPILNSPDLATANTCTLLSTTGTDKCAGVIGAFIDGTAGTPDVPVLDNTGHPSCDIESPIANPVSGSPESQATSPPHYTVSINWGDGSPADLTTGTISEPDVAGNPCVFTVSGTHVYTAPGTYDVAATVTDEGVDGAQGSSVTVHFWQLTGTVAPAASCFGVGVPQSTCPNAGPSVIVPPSTVPGVNTSPPAQSVVAQYNLPTTGFSPQYVFNLTMYGYKTKQNGSNAPSNGVGTSGSGMYSAPPWLLGHVNLLDQDQGLKIPPFAALPIKASCQNLLASQPSPSQCKLIPLGLVCASGAANMYTPLVPAGGYISGDKDATIWVQYTYGGVGTTVSRWARFDVLMVPASTGNPAPGTPADDFLITMSSATNPAVAVTSIPPTQLGVNTSIKCT